MICLVSQNFNCNRILLLAIGLWPYQRTILVRLQLIFLFSILAAAIIFQFTTFVTSNCTVDLVIRVLSSTFLFISSAIKYNSFCINAKVVKDFLRKLQRICDELKDENELAIIEKYGNISKRYTVGLTIMIVSCLCAFMVVCSFPRILHIALSRNKSRLNRLWITTEYFVDQEKYFYLIMLHTNVAFCLGIVVLLATGTMLLAYFYHICGMFSISSYRIRYAMQIDMLTNINLKKQSLINEKIICAVDIHRKAMRYSEYVISKFEMSFVSLIACGVIALSLNLFRIVSSKNIDDIALPLLFAFICIVYMFFANFTGQAIIDHNKQIYSTAYNVPWYTAPVYIQKLILFLLQRGSKDFSLNIRGLFVGSLEGFAMLTNASLSYFTVMYSTRS